MDVNSVIKNGELKYDEFIVSSYIALIVRFTYLEMIMEIWQVD